MAESEQELWDEATAGMNKKGRYKLASWLAHSCVHKKNIEGAAVLYRKDLGWLIITKTGEMFQGKRVL